MHGRIPGLEGVSGKAVGVVAGLLVIGALLTVGLTQSRSDSAPASEDPVEVRLIDEEFRNPVPTFSAKLGNGKNFTNKNIQGPALIHVFASWCSVCQEEGPKISEVMATRKDMNYYFIAVEDEPEKSLEHADKHGWTDEIASPTIVNDTKRAVAQDAFGLSGQPHTLVVNSDSEVVWVRQGPGSLGEILGAVDAVSA